MTLLSLPSSEVVMVTVKLQSDQVLQVQVVQGSFRYIWWTEIRRPVTTTTSKQGGN